MSFPVLDIRIAEKMPRSAAFYVFLPHEEDGHMRVATRRPAGR